MSQPFDGEYLGSSAPGAAPTGASAAPGDGADAGAATADPSRRPLAAILATLPSGLQFRPLSRDELERYLTREYLDSKPEQERMQRHAMRQDLYQDGGLRHINKLIDEVYDKTETRKRRKMWAKVARFNNLIKRIVGTLSTVYQEPATRTVGAANDNAKYSKLQRLCKQHVQARQINRLLNLHRSLWVGFRVRQFDRKPVIDIYRPDCVRVITHPNDATLAIGVIIDVSYKTAVVSKNAPKHLVWTNYERFHMTATGSIINYVVHQLPAMPLVHVALDPPTDGFWPGEAGEDLVGAHMTAWFANTSLLKETKSATKFQVAQGDMSGVAREQVQDSDDVVEMPEGSSMSTQDNSMDPDLFIGTADHAADSTASNYGISRGEMKHESVQSADAAELRRTPLKELRREQIIVFADFEREFVEVQSMVLTAEGHDLAFSTDGWAIRWGESRTPLGAKEELEVFEAQRRLGVTNTIRFLMEKYDLDEEQAWEMLFENITIETARNVLMKGLQAISGSLDAGQPVTPPPGAPEPEPGNDPTAAPPPAPVETINQRIAA